MGDFEGVPNILRGCVIFQLQTFEVDGIQLNLFSDSGCGDVVIKKSAIDKLIVVGRAKQIVSGPPLGKSWGRGSKIHQ